MSCFDPESLTAFADGEIDASAVAAIERHLHDCASCRQFVDEMRRLDACGRSALRTIHVMPHGRSVVIPEAATRPRVLRPVALAAAALIFVIVSGAFWFVAFRHREPRPAAAPIQAAKSPGSTDRLNTAQDKQPASGDDFRASSDETFERWAEPYRRLRIPLVPLEEVANHKPPEILPTLPATTKPNI
ncbi:MAG: hypothetical protein DME19_02645 [Verrucomicrobia bacterium]|nr:MAG: hypothetical protein DME19_02645 [Verrucomicrobiota bacterium]